MLITDTNSDTTMDLFIPTITLLLFFTRDHLMNLQLS